MHKAQSLSPPDLLFPTYMSPISQWEKGGRITTAENKNEDSESAEKSPSPHPFSVPIGVRLSAVSHLLESPFVIS